MIMILIMRNGSLPRRAAALAMFMALAALAALAGCGGDASGARGKPTVVVTTAPLGALVSELVGDTADVRVVIPNNLDPHDFQPSVKDAQRLADADLIVANGAGLESSLGDAIHQAEGDGVPVFTAADHVPLRDGADDHGAHDPHIWLDPIRMRDAMDALAPVAATRLGVDLGGRPAALHARLTALSARLETMAQTIPPARRLLVTGHDSMGYFAARYGFTVVGAVIPSLSSQAEASAAQVATVVATIRRERVPAIFTEVGTPKSVADAIASDSGARVVPLNTHAVTGGGYEATMRGLMAAVVGGLGGG